MQSYNADYTVQETGCMLVEIYHGQQQVNGRVEINIRNSLHI